MSLINALRHEVKPTSTVSSRPLPESSSAPAQVESPVQHLAADDDLGPREGQTVFEQTLGSRTTESRRLAITVLLVLANLVQVLWPFSFKSKLIFVAKLTMLDDR